MKKRLVLAIGGLVAILMGVAMFAAFESHQINVEAHVEKATFLDTTQIDIGTVFPQENIIIGCFVDPVTNKIVQLGFAPCATIHLSESFKAQTRVIDVHYDVYWVDKPCIPSAGDGDPTTTGDTKKCEGVSESDIDPVTRLIPGGPFVEHDICLYMQIFDSDPNDNNDVVLAPSPFTCVTPPTPGNPTKVATGTLITQLDEWDIWDLIFWVPVCEENFNPETDPGPNPPAGIPPTTPDCWDPEGVGGSYGETDLSNELKFQITAYSFGP